MAATHLPLKVKDYLTIIQLLRSLIPDRANKLAMQTPIAFVTMYVGRTGTLGAGSGTRL